MLHIALRRGKGSKGPPPSSATRKMYFEYLHDPGVKLRSKKRDLKERAAILNAIDARERTSDSIVERWSVVFERVWYVGHIIIMTLSILSILACLTRQILRPWPRLLYRLDFVFIVITYTISLLQNLNGATPGFYALLPLETFQSIILAMLWIFTTPHTIKLVIYALYSLLHVADSASAHHADSKSRAAIAKRLSEKYAPKVISIRGYLDMWLLVELLRDCLLIRKGAVISLVVFGSFFRIKLKCAPLVFDNFMDVYHRTNKFMVRENTPKKLRDMWIRFRNRIEPDAVNDSHLYQQDTDKAIEMANLYNSLNN